MTDMDRDIEAVRKMVQDAWIDRNWVAWLFGSCMLLGFRIARIGYRR